MKKSGRVLILGLDGATWTVLRPLVKKGILKNLGKLVEQGASGVLYSTIPPATLPAWPSFMTGMNPGKHGVYDFMKVDRRALKRRLVTYTDLKAPAFWELLAEDGLKPIVVSVPFTYPPTALRIGDGCAVSGMLTPPGANPFNPPSLRGEVENAVGGYFYESKYDFMEIPLKKVVSVLKDLTRNRVDIAEYLMRRVDWDFAMVVFRSTDLIQHRSWGYGEKVVEIYRHLDSEVERLLHLIDLEKDLVVVMSDHGFGQLRKFFNVNVWLHRQGLLHFKVRERGGRAALVKKEKRGEERRAPSFLGRVAAKIGVSRDLVRDWFSKLKLRKLAHHVPQSVRRLLGKLPEVDVDWSRSKAYFASLYTTETHSININLKGREPEGIVDRKEYDALRELIIERLKKVVDPETKEAIVHEAFTREEAYQGPYLEEAPDIVFLPSPGYHASWYFTEPSIVTKTDGIRGCHRPEGVLIVAGADVRKCRTTASIMDLAPTILHIYGLPVFREMDGRVLTEIFDEESEVARREVRYTSLFRWIEAKKIRAVAEKLRAR